MRNISTYIEYTLMTRHYVFVPGIGGFLLRDIDATYANGKYTPSHREVHFNRFLTNDDGMLANAYMQAEGISYDEAISQIKIEVATIKSAIERNKSYELGKLGILSYDSNHHLVVKNPKQYPLDPDNYGLDILTIRPWAEVEKEQNTPVVPINNQKHDDSISIPMYWVRRAVICILVILCLFANMHYFTNEDTRKVEYAAMFDTEILMGNALPHYTATVPKDNSWESEVILANTDSIAEEATSVDSNVVLADNTSKAVTESKETINEIPLQRATEKASGSSDNLYYIIIASCTTYEDALRAAKKKISDGYGSVGILEKDGRFRLYLKSFTDKAQGKSYLEEVRVSTPFQKAWLLPVKKESLLSLILKNIDNDQLPMELSHPYKRTERDQGWINT